MRYEGKICKEKGNKKEKKREREQVFLLQMNYYQLEKIARFVMYL